MGADPIVCGRNGVPCPRIEDYPICKPEDTSQAWIGLKRLGIKPSSDPTIQLPFIKLVPVDVALQEGARNPTDDEVGKIVSEGWLEKNGFMGICRSGYINANEPYKWYVYQQNAGSVGKVVLFNEYSRGTHGDKLDQTPIPLTKAEAFGLVRALGLGIYDLACKEGQCVKEQSDGTYSDGNYFFTTDSSRLTTILVGLVDDKKVKIEGLSKDKRDKLMAHIAAIKLRVDFPMENARLQRQFLEAQEADRTERLWTGRAQLVLTLLLLAAIGYQPAKDVVAWWKGRVKKKDFGKMIRETLEKNPDYQVLGRSREVKKAWRMADRPSFHNLIIDAKFGVGKDKVVEAMGLDRARGSQAVPPRFRNAPWFEFSATDYIAGTQYRGNVGDKVKELIKLAEKGPVIVYVSEIDKVMLHGAADKTRSEETGGLLLGDLARPEIKKNIMLVGTTSRLAEMHALYPYLSRRFNILDVEEFKPSEIADILDGVDPETKAKGFRAIQETEVYYGVKVPREMLDLAVRLCEKYYAPQRAFIDRQTGDYVFARFDTNLELIQFAGILARDRGAAEMTEADLIQAAEELSMQTINRVEIEALRTADADALMIMTSRRDSGDMSTQFARAFRMNDVLKGIFEGRPDTEAFAKAQDLAEQWKAVPPEQRARIIARSGGQTISGVPVYWILDRVSQPAEVCEAPAAPVFEGAQTMSRPAAPAAPGTPLEARLSSMAAVVTDVPTRMILERMLADLTTADGRARVESVLTLLGNSVNAERGLTIARIMYEAPPAGPECSAESGAAPGEARGLPVPGALDRETLRRTMAVRPPAEVAAEAARECARVEAAGARPVETSAGRAEKR